MNQTSAPQFVTFGELLRYLRKRMQLSQEELGRALGYSRVMITRLENGERMPDPAMVKTVFVEALGLTQEPELAARLVDLAALARASSARVGTVSTAYKEPMGRANLPPALTRFIGREREIDTLLRLMSDHRLVTLTGSGGVGKTRLALELGRRVTFMSVDRIWLVELATISDAAMVPSTIAKVLGLSAIPSLNPVEQLVAFLRDARCLLILDNCEHLLEESARLVEHLLLTCPGLRVLATSREALRSSGEQAWRVRPLEAPKLSDLPAFEDARQFEAIQLFEQHACSADASFALNREMLPAVVHICHQLGGIPLAIEMAAAQIAACTIEEIATGLNLQLDNLTGGRRTALPRHQTLRAAMDWSYRLLNPAEQHLLARLAVFAGGWTADAAARVCDATLSNLHDLVGKSMVVATPSSTGTRYHMLEIMRQFAAEKLRERGLPEQDALAQRHLAYFIELCEETMDLGGAHVTEWARRVEADYANIRAAYERSRAWSARDRGEAMLRLAGGLRPYWHNRGGIREGLAWLDEALAIGVAAPDEARAKALLARGTNSYLINRPSAIAFIKQSLTLFEKIGHKAGMASALETISIDDHQPEGVLRAHKLFVEIGSLAGQARTIRNLGHIAYGNPGGATLAKSYYQQALDIGLETKDRNVVYECFTGLSAIDPELGERLCQQAIEQLTEIDEAEYRATLFYALGVACVNTVKLEAAREALECSMAIWRKQGTLFTMHGGTGSIANLLGYVYQALGETTQAIAVWSEAAHSSRIGLGVDALEAEIRLALLHKEYGEAASKLKQFLANSVSSKALTGDIGDDLNLIVVTTDFASALLGRGNRIPALTLLGAISAAVKSHEVADGLSWARSYGMLQYMLCTHAISSTRATISGDEEQAAWSDGEQLPMEIAVDRAMKSVA